MPTEQENSSSESETKPRTRRKRATSSRKKRNDNSGEEQTNHTDDSGSSQNDDSNDGFGSGLESSESQENSSTETRSDEGGEPKKRRRRQSRSRNSEGSNDRNKRRSSGRGSSSNSSSNSSNRGGNNSNRGQSSNNSNRGRNRSQNRSGGGGGRGRGGQGHSDSGRDRSSREPKDIEITGSVTGVLELHPKGYGFIRDGEKNYMSQEYDPFVSSSLVEKYGLKEGVKIVGEIGPGTRSQGPRLYNVATIDGRSPEEYAKVKNFEELTAINPFEQIKLEVEPDTPKGKTGPVTMRVMDILTPIGKGQRALLVAPPRTGKTMLLQDIANSVSINHPEIHLIVLLIDERPEEVTEMRRSVNGEVIASSMDNDVESHVRISQLIFERGKRLAEAGEDVLILLDSITRTARAFNKWIGNSGRTMTGGLDVKAMDIPKKMFGTARRFDEGGSLTVVGTALIDTGSRMDEVIFQEFKGTGNMELVLSRDLADRRIWPAIDIGKSGTRREEKILDPDSFDSIVMLRRSLISLNAVEAMEQLTRTLDRFSTNQDFLTKVRDIL
ncbi:Transcription termination factor Rho [hydrothermal vent metagenome]|uniref:Transcription termination factor Rho n=1 Tax=hydrothermal vent metagenome TaxID=652676 RepID=A0A3B1E775_9ZZZZ